MTEFEAPQDVAPEPEAVETPPTPTPEPTPVGADEPAPVLTGKPAERGPDIQMLVVTDLGYGARMTLAQFRKAHRGTRGTRAMYLTEKNGNLIGAKVVKDGDVVTILTKKGMAGLFPIDDIKVKGRGISGVRVMTLADDDCVVAIV